MYQLEVKKWLVKYRFLVSDGWDVTIDIDSMERAKGGQHPADKAAIAQQCESWIKEQGVNICAHPVYGRADLVASHPDVGTFVIEVEGDSSRQKEQAMYSALGQIVLSMVGINPRIVYGLAFPDNTEWEKHIKKIPRRVRQQLRLRLYLVSPSGVRELDAM